ncbi:MAG: PDZ domain-containing protein, partial [Eudoraea sp.]|nr:PDZ domain-containing protein [Eudoraea sp.]
ILKQNTATPYFGAMVAVNPDGTATIQEHTRIGSPAYLSGLDKGDVIRSINGMSFENDKNFSRHISKFKIGERLDIAYHRFGKEGRTKVVLSANPSYTIELQQKSEREVTDKILKNRKDWLKIK